MRLDPQPCLGGGTVGRWSPGTVPTGSFPGLGVGGFVPLWALLGGQTTTERTNGPLVSNAGADLCKEKPEET